MLTATIVRIIGFCVARAWLVTTLGVLIAIGSGVYAANHFAINSDINAVLPNDIGWRKREAAFEAAFRRFELIEVVVEAPTPEQTTAATADLAEALRQDKKHFQDVALAGGSQFFAEHGILFQSKEQLQQSFGGLAQGQALITDLSTDRSLRGLVAGLEDALLGIQDHKIKLDDLTRPLNMASDTLDAALKGQPAAYSWRVLAEGKPAQPVELRGFIQVRPVMDFTALQPGEVASNAIRTAAAGIAPKYQATVRLTGPVAMSDEQFGSIKENALRNGLITLAIVLCILWLALRSGRLIVAVAINLLIGLAATAAVGLLLVGAFNLISVYFAVLFVGIGLDFGIQYSVRYRAERHEVGDLTAAVKQAGFYVGAPLTLAGFATAAGFFSFLPTDYRGVSELGLIAGAGMLIAYATSITILPALIVLFNPAGEPEPLGYTSLAPIDEWMSRHRLGIIAGTAIAVVAGLPLLYWLSFDFNPIALQNPNGEAVATYLELARDPSTDSNAIQVLAPSPDQANAIAARMAKLPEVSHVMTLSTFIPDDQSEKLPILRDAAAKLAGAFDQKNAQAPPTDAENVDALKEGADRLLEAAGDAKGVGPGAEAAKRLAADLTALANAPPPVRAQAQDAFIRPLSADLAALQGMLQAQPITRESLPADLVDDWIAQDGRVRVSISPKDDPGDNEAMRRFAKAVLNVQPDAIEGPVSITEAGDLVVNAFIQAGAYALISIALLLWIVLRRISDVLLTLIPLALAGVVTLEITVLIGLRLNFANIIALPLLLGVGVAFKIYYIMAWREGVTHLLQTSLTRAVIYSALTTATAFGSLCFSSHPGTASMGKLLALSLVCTLCAAVLFQPILMGKPRNPAAAKAANPPIPTEKEKVL